MGGYRNAEEWSQKNDFGQKDLLDLFVGEGVHDTCQSGSVDRASIAMFLATLRDTLKETAQEHKKAEIFQIEHEPDCLTHYLDKALEMDNFIVDDTLLYVLCLDEEKLKTPFRTLVFFSDGRLIKTRERSNKVMDALFEVVGFSYDFVRSASMRVSGKETHCVPYILGKYCYLPVNGPTRKNVSWINLSAIVRYQPMKGEKGVEVHCCRQHTIKIPIRYSYFNDKITQSCAIYNRQNYLLSHFMRQFDYVDARKRTNSETGILKNGFHSQGVHTPKLSLENYIRIFQVTLAESALRHPAFKDNPVADEAVFLMKEILYKEMPHLKGFSL